MAPPAPPPPQLPGFTVRRPLGVGAMASVWECVRHGDDQVVAIKLSSAHDTATIRRFQLEAHLTALVGTPHAPAVYESHTSESQAPFMVMEKVSGLLLADVLERAPGPFPLEAFRRVGLALVNAVAAAHRAKVAHCDLKPENVFLRTPDHTTAALIDFGIAKLLGASELSEELVAGTPEYMAPEQFGTKAQTGTVSDVYSLGVMLFELATTRLPFFGEQKELEYAHRSLRAPRASAFAAVPAPIDDVIFRCLEKNPEARPADAVALATTLSEAISRVEREAAQTPASPAVSAIQGSTEKPSKAKAETPSEKQRVTVAFIRLNPVDQPRAQVVLKAFGASIAQSANHQCAAVWGHSVGENPARRAFTAASALSDEIKDARVLLEVQTVTSKPRPDGTARYLSAAFSKDTSYPKETDEPGVLVSATCHALIPDVPVVADRDGLSRAPRSLRTSTQISTSVKATGSLTPLIGRDALLDQLLADAQATFTSNQPHVATVLGEAGYGKSRLAQGLVSRLNTVDNIRVIDLRVLEPVGRNADDTLAALLKTVLQLPEAPPADWGRAHLVERLGDVGHIVFAGVALIVGWIPPARLNELAPQSAPGVVRGNASRAAAEGLKKLAERHPVAVVIDDVHWAETGFLDALERVTVEETRVWTCVFGKPNFEAARPAWGQRAPLHTPIRLPALDHATAAVLCRALFPPDAIVPQSVITRLVERTEGVPRLLIDLYQGLVRDGLVRTQLSGASYVATEVLDRLPDLPLLDWLTTREIETLPNDLAAHARLAALLAPDVGVAELEFVLRTLPSELAATFPLDALVGLRALRSARILIGTSRKGFSFQNPLMRDALVRSVPADVRAAVHLAAQRYFEGATTLSDSIRLPRLARHSAAAGNHAVSATTFMAAADTARLRHDALSAEVFFTQALTELDKSQGSARDRLAAYQGRGVMRYRIGRHDDSLGDFDQARALAHELNDHTTEADVLLDEAMALDWLEELHRSKELALKAQALSGDIKDELHQARVLLAVGRSHLRFAENAEALDRLRKASSLGQSLGERGYEVTVTADLLLGFALTYLNGAEEAAERLERVEKLASACGDEMHLTAMHLNRACLWIATNDAERFAQDTKQTFEISRRIGNQFLERNSQFNAAYFHHWRAEDELAERYCQRAIEVDRRRFRAGFRPESVVLLVRIWWCLGKLDEAISLTKTIRAEQEKARAEGKKEILLTPNDDILLDVISAILGLIDAPWPELLARARKFALGQELIEIFELRGLHAVQQRDYEAARAVWLEALEVSKSSPNSLEARIRERLAKLPAAPPTT